MDDEEINDELDPDLARIDSELGENLEPEEEEEFEEEDYGEEA